MNLQKLGKQLKRELGASPKKAAALALLLVAGGYFWIPLVWKSDEPAAASPMAAGSLVVAPQTSTGTASVEPSPVTVPQATEYSWKELVAALESDQRMQPVDTLPDVRDPFASDTPIVETPSEDELNQSQLEQQLAAITPEELGITLQGTVVGRQNRTALINGRTYQPGEQLVVSDLVKFELIDVQRGYVVLAREGQSHRVKIAQPQVSGRIEIHDTKQ